MMKKILLLALFALTSFFSQVHADDASKITLPDSAHLSQICDSIVVEGLRLYAYETLAWHSSDSLMRYCKVPNEINGSGIYVDSTATFHYFYSRDDDVVFSYHHRFSDDLTWWDATIRPMDEMEIEARQMRRECINLAIETYGDSIRYNSSSGSMNIDVIRVSPELIRVYFLQGSNYNNVIPIGNDYSVDIDRNNKVLGFRRYHHTFLPISVEIDDEPVRSIVHSHTPDNPFITATDICNFLLYGRDLYDMEVFYVLPTAFKERYLEIFNSNDMTISFADYDSFKNNTDKGDD